MSCLQPYLRIKIGNYRKGLIKVKNKDTGETEDKFIDYEAEGIIREKALIVFDLPSNRKKLEESNTAYDVIPCGCCDECFKRRVRDWSIRIVQETNYHKENYFITLTYDDSHLPKNNSVDKKGVQRFFKRLKDYVRNNIDKEIKFKYYCVAEYGEGKGERYFVNPHYHFISFGLPLINDGLTYIFPDGHKHTSQSGDALMYSPMLSKLWENGFVTVQEVTFGSASYVAGYVHKKLRENKPVIHQEVDFFRSPDGRALALVVPVRYNPYEVLGIEKPFSLMSKGIGEKYFVEHSDIIFKTDEVFYNSGQFGVLSSLPPRYFVKKLEQHNPEKAQQIKDKRKSLASTTISIDSDNKAFYNKYVREGLIKAKREARKRGLTSYS